MVNTRCQKVSKATYEFLTNDSKTNDVNSQIHWYCKHCNVGAHKVVSLLSNISSRQDNLEKEIGSMKIAQEETEKEVQELSHKMKTKVDKDVLEKSLIEHTEELREEIRHIGKNINELPQGSVEDKIAETISAKVNEVNREQEDRKRRECNVIMYNIKEATEEGWEARQTSTKKEIHKVLSHIEASPVVVKFNRLGKFDREQQKPRPLRVAMKEKDMARDTIKKARRLKDAKEPLKDVFISYDRTPKERENRRKLVEELKERKSQGEENLKIVGENIVNRDDTDTETGGRVRFRPQQK